MTTQIESGMTLLLFFWITCQNLKHPPLRCLRRNRGAISSPASLPSLAEEKRQGGSCILRECELALMKSGEGQIDPALLKPRIYALNDDQMFSSTEIWKTHCQSVALEMHLPDNEETISNLFSEPWLSGELLAAGWKKAAVELCTSTLHNSDFRLCPVRQSRICSLPVLPMDCSSRSSNTVLSRVILKQAASLVKVENQAFGHFRNHSRFPWQFCKSRCVKPGSFPALLIILQPRKKETPNQSNKTQNTPGAILVAYDTLSEQLHRDDF